ncbi:hypothetical protein [Cryobacterium arcticum]|uniref:DUF4190 domain-containing protein n=1 Tax=Cryobacterium arcticum TaxID=670052 RepID=A0A317ZQ37_9MICO|nr:hypothetical protein [Cryobacterium arcticum]PXA68610.1 hypothetical protein CTB96_18675 [Cryobacterium arcticum]
MPQPGQPDTRAQPQQPAAPAGAPATPAAGVQAQSRAQARAQAARESAVPTGLTRPPVAGELAYESTITAPTEWVPYVYTTAEIQTHAARRGLSVAAAVFGLAGVGVGIFMIWGVPLSLAAVVLALVARFVERRAGGIWIIGLVSGIVGILMGVLWFIVNTELLPAFYG